VDKIAKSSTHTPFARVQSATSFPEIRDGRELAVYWSSSVPAGVEGVASLLSRVFVLESSVNIANEMIVIVVANHHFLNFAILAHLAPEIFIERVEVVL
jgi:hypothetical protein